MDTQVSRTEWAAVLQDFGNRNAGRRAWLEVDDPLIGAQEQEHGLQLMGLSYDNRDQRVQIMFGIFGGMEPHLTHTMGDVVQIHIVTDDHGRDVVLYVAQPEVQTMLRIEPRALS